MLARGSPGHRLGLFEHEHQAQSRARDASFAGDRRAASDQAHPGLIDGVVGYSMCESNSINHTCMAIALS